MKSCKHCGVPLIKVDADWWHSNDNGVTSYTWCLTTQAEPDPKLTVDELKQILSGFVDVWAVPQGYATGAGGRSGSDIVAMIRLDQLEDAFDHFVSLGYFIQPKGL